MDNLVLNYIVEKPMLLREFLAAKNISKKTLTRIKFDKDGMILVNGVERNVRYLLNVNDKVSITLPSEQFSPNVRFIEENINIVYEDSYLLIVSKPSNLPSIPSRNERDSSLLEQVNYYFRENNYKTIPHIVTRLDKNTTGLVLIAKHRHIHALFSKINIEKYYLALTKGKIPSYKIIEAPIKREVDSIITRTVHQDGDYAKTQLERVFYDNSTDISLARLKLFTGRTHQIRVHMKYLGFSLLGDELYEGDTSVISRQALHCENLIFSHPITNKPLNVKNNLPEDMAKIVQNIL